MTISTAEKLTALLESLPLGELWAEPYAAAESAIAAEQATADAKLCPSEIVPVDAPTQNQYVEQTGRWPAIGYSDRALDCHGRCVTSHPALARCLRSPECLEDIAVAAARQAAPAHDLETHQVAGARAASQAVSRYKLALAQQLSAIDGHELQAAGRDLLACEELSRRVAAAKARHEEHAKVELARSDAERLAAEAAITAEYARRAAELRAQAGIAAAEAQRRQHEIRRARGEVLREVLEAKLARATKPDRLMLRGRLYSDVAELARNAPHLSNEQLEQYEEEIKHGRFEETGAEADPWRRS